MTHVPLFWVIAVELALAVGLVSGGLARMREQRRTCGRCCETPSSGDEARNAAVQSSGPGRHTGSEDVPPTLGARVGTTTVGHIHAGRHADTKAV